MLISLLVVSGALLTVILLRAIITLIHKPSLRGFPGPWYTRVTHYVLKFHTLAGRRMHYVHSLHQRYGSVVRLSPNQLAFCDPDAFVAIHKIGGGFTKTQWYEDFSGGAGGAGIGIGLFAMTDVKKHASRRKLFARAFSAASLRSNCEDVVKEKVEKAVSRIMIEARDTGEADIMKWWMLMASDIIGQLSFGESFELLDSGEKSHHIHVLEAAALGATLQYEMPGILGLLRRIPVPKLNLLVTAPNLVHRYGQAAVLNLLRHSDNRANLFATMLAQSEVVAEKFELTDDDIRKEASNFILAGADTTAITLTYLVWVILKRPGLRVRIEEEVSSPGLEVSDEALERLPLLNAVIEETLRLYGAVPGNLPRKVPEGGVSLGGYAVPEGIEVETQAYSLHRDPNVFPDPLMFDETRWMGKDILKPKSYCPFGAGTRTCAGVHLARMEIRLAAATLFRHCKGLRLSARMNDQMMEPANFFLATPVGKRCDVRF
ncbi:unnamed protein product [Clonostachys rosea]|uniref:Cytochrome P450 n=1 Tax=Bionectria ochroleuca TaxID=29856 RepID=A0ABY6UKW2_BIOOC|nr:unnamed protein product [Clonostachys rosea]